MLVLTRKAGERIVIADNIVVEVLEIQGNRVRIGIQAPHGVTILREELLTGKAGGEKKPGEMATVSGKPRTATVTAAQPCELLELDKAALDQIAGRHPHIREVLEEIYIARATSPEAARVRSGAPRRPPSP